MQKKISKSSVDRARENAKNTGERLYMYDTVLRGFGCMASKTGAASYFIEYSQNGRQRRKKIGQHGPMTPAQARSLAQQLLGKAAAGESLSDNKSKATVRDTLELFYKIHAKDNRYWHERKLHVENNAGALLETGIVNVKRSDIAALIDKAAMRAPSAGRHLLTALRPFFKWAVQRGYVHSNPCSDLSAPGKAIVRDRVLTDDELKQIWNASEVLGFPFGGIIRMLILTGQRRSEVAGMSWSEIERDVWTIPKHRTKNNRTHEVDLHPLALEVLSNLPEAGELIFSTTGTTPPSGFSVAKKRLDHLIPDIEPWRLHDIRRSVASGMSALGELPIVIEHVLNHTSGERGGLVSVYQQYSYRPERKLALKRWGDHISQVVLVALID